MKTIGIYNGHFQPPTRAHLGVYKKLRQIVGPDVFIVTTDHTPTPDAPLNFGDKEQIWVRHGIPSSHIVRVRDWERPTEIFNNFSNDHTSVIFALNPKEAEDLPVKKGTSGQIKSPSVVKEELSPVGSSSSSRISNNNSGADVKSQPDSTESNREVWLNDKGQLSYFQPYKGNERSMAPLSKHGYVMIEDDTQIERKPISTANIRHVLGSKSYPDDDKKRFFRFVFGWFDIGLYSLMASKFRYAHQNAYPGEERLTSMPSMKSLIRGQPNKIPTSNATISNAFKSQIQELVYEVLGEIMDEDYDTMINTPDDSDNITQGMADTLGDEKMSSTQQKVDAQKKKADLVKQKKAIELQSKQDKEQRDSYATTVKNYDTIKKKSNRDALNAVNQQISHPIQPTPSFQ